MSTNALFGRYWPAESVVHRLDARTKAIGTLLWVVACFCAGNVIALCFIALFMAVIIGLSKIPFGQVLRSVLPLMFIVVISVIINIVSAETGTVLVDWGWLRITDDSLASAGFAAVRLTLLLLGGSMLTLCTTALDITDAFEHLLSPFARFGLPAHEFAMVMGIALKFLPQFVEEFQAIRAAQLSRGAKLATSPVKGRLAGLTSLLVPLFASAFRHADTLAQAMDSRCYHGAVGRTHLHPLKYTRTDVAAFAVMGALVAVTISLTQLF